MNIEKSQETWRKCYTTLEWSRDLPELSHFDVLKLLKDETDEHLEEEITSE